MDIQKNSAWLAGSLFNLKLLLNIILLQKFIEVIAIMGSFFFLITKYCIKKVVFYDNTFYISLVKKY